MSSTPPAAASESSEASPKPARKRSLRCAILIILPIAAVLCGLSVLLGVGLQDLNASPLQVAVRESSLPAAPEGYALSDAQQSLINASGYPDSFTILFYEDDFDGSSARIETWTYAQDGHSYTFENGEQTGTQQFDPLTGEVITAPYSPALFTAYMSLDEILAATGIEEFMLVPLEDELVSRGESYFADRLAFGLKDGDLLYVEAIGFVGDEAADAAADASDDAGVAADITEFTAPTDAPSPADVPPTEAPSYGLDGYPPLVWVSEENDPNWPDCEATDDGCHSEIFLQYPYHPTALSRSLTAGMDFEWVTMPALSHDGQRVAFAGRIDGQTDVYVIDIDGSNLTQITHGEGTSWMPTWAPNDEMLAFVSDRDGDNRWNIFITLVDRKAVQQITEGQVNDRHIDWAPNGETIAFNSDRGDESPGTCYPDCLWQLYEVNLIGEVSRLPVTSDEGQLSQPAYSPDGGQIAFHAGHDGRYDIYVLDLATESVRRITEDTEPPNNLSPSWSPDGQKLAYSSGGGDYNYDIAVTPIESFDPLWHTGAGAADYFPDW